MIVSHPWGAQLSVIGIRRREIDFLTYIQESHEHVEEVDDISKVVGSCGLGMNVFAKNNRDRRSMCCIHLIIVNEILIDIMCSVNRHPSWEDENALLLYKMHRPL